MKAFQDQEVVVNDEAVSGLLGWFGTPWVLEKLHRHSDIEVNFIARGEMRCLIGGQVQTIHCGEIAVFWAVTPHRITHCDEQTLMGLLHIPLLEFLRWNMPSELQDPLLRGKVMVEHSTQRLDDLLFRQWATDMQCTRVPTPTPHPEEHSAALLEIQARLLRLTRDHATRPLLHSPVTAEGRALSKAEQLAEVLADRHAEAVDLSTLVEVTGLHPNYAMALFRDTFGMTMLQYLTQHRVAHAQRLLITSELSILDVALESGFSSVGHFYNMFKRSSGVAPRQYRELHRGR